MRAIPLKTCANTGVVWLVEENKNICSKTNPLLWDGVQQSRQHHFLGALGINGADENGTVVNYTFNPLYCKSNCLSISRRSSLPTKFSRINYESWSQNDVIYVGFIGSVVIHYLFGMQIRLHWVISHPKGIMYHKIGITKLKCSWTVDTHACTQRLSIGIKSHRSNKKSW